MMGIVMNTHIIIIFIIIALYLIKNYFLKEFLYIIVTFLLWLSILLLLGGHKGPQRSKYKKMGRNYKLEKGDRQRT